ncbi:MAG TPA: hypothetical protein VIN67_06665 [Desulfobaccales bacterium]
MEVNPPHSLDFGLACFREMGMNLLEVTDFRALPTGNMNFMIYLDEMY